MLAAFAPLSPQDLRLGAGLAFRPAAQYFWRLDVVQHETGLTLNRRFSLGDVLELTGGVGVYYDWGTHDWVPQITVGKVAF